MSNSYSGDPNTSALDQVRFLIDDRGPNPIYGTFMLQDEEILYLLARFPNTLLAASRAALQIAAQLGKMATSRSVGGLSISRSNLYSSYLTLAKSLRERAVAEGVTSFPVGGQTRVEHQNDERDSGLAQPAFRRQTGFGWPTRAGTVNDPSRV